MPPRKKPKVVNAPIVEYKAGEEKWVRFGWCSDGHHGGCRIEFPGYRCKCECHGGGIIDTDGEVSDE